ncbi:hypothetical protein PG988_001893 [Apiospora saccharicola]
MASTPMAKFVGTTELLEHMFLESDQQTLLTALQRVCCRWRDIIRTSPALQVHLFRKPAHAPAREGLVVEPILNPLLVTKFPYFFTRVQQQQQQQQTDDVDPDHPHPSPDDDDDNGRTNNDSTVFYSQEQFYRLPLAADPEPYLRPEASWRTMHDVTMGLLYDYVLGALLSSASPPTQRPRGGRQDEVRREWRMVWGRVDGLDPRMELWGDYYEGIRRQLETEVDAVLILRSQGGGGGQQQQQGADDDDDDEEDEGDGEREGEEDEAGDGSNNRSLDRLTHPHSVMLRRPAPLGVRAATEAARD